MMSEANRRLAESLSGEIAQLDSELAAIEQRISNLTMRRHALTLKLRKARGSEGPAITVACRICLAPVVVNPRSRVKTLCGSGNCAAIALRRGGQRGGTLKGNVLVEERSCTKCGGIFVVRGWREAARRTCQNRANCDARAHPAPYCPCGKPAKRDGRYGPYLKTCGGKRCLRILRSVIGKGSAAARWHGHVMIGTRVLELLKACGSLPTAAIAAHLGTSQDSIRNRLKPLISEGKIVRERGASGSSIMRLP